MTDHLLLVDCSAFAYRSFYTAAPIHRDSDGQPIGAVLGFMGRMWQMLGAASADPPTLGAAVFDAPGKTFRHKLFPAYKSNRPPARAIELECQFPYMRHAADALGLTPVEKANYEADDVLATLADRARKAGIRTTIVSPDKDLLQTVVDDWVEVVDPLNRRRLRSAEVRKKFGVDPHLVPDVQALCGDSADGIPGINGLGPDRAAALIRRMGSLEAVLAAPHECRWPQVRAQLKRHADDARLYYKLTTLRRNVRLDVELEDLRLQPVMRSHLMEILRVLEAPAYMEAIFALDPQMARPVEPVCDPLEWWREELAAPGQRLPDEPQCGFYQRRLVRKGAMVPARIWREPELDPISALPTGRDLIRCVLGGRPADPMSEWPRLATQPIREEDFEFETADADHAKKYRPNHPKADPRKPVDLSKLPVPHNPKAKRSAKL